MRRVFASVALSWALTGPALALAQEPGDQGLEAPAGTTQPAEASGAIVPGPAPAGAGAELPDDAEESRQILFASLSMTDEQRAGYAAHLRQVVQAVRGDVTDTIVARVEARQATKLDRLGLVLSIIACSGLLLLLMPLVLCKRYPNRAAVLWRYSALAAGLFFLTVNLFAGVLFIMRGTQAVVGEQTNPQVKIVESTFDFFENQAEDVALIGPSLVEPTLRGLTGESEEPVITIMLDNVQKFRNDLQVFSTIGDLFVKLDWLFGMLPIILAGVAVLLFIQMARPTLTEIVKLPEHAAQGGASGIGVATVVRTMRNVWAEAKATFASVGLLIALTLVAGTLLGLVLTPALEVFVSYLALSMLYVQLTGTASTFWVAFSLLGAIIFLVIHLAVVILATAFYLARAQRSFQARFRERVPLIAQSRLWKWGTVAALWAMVLPVLYIHAAVKAIGWFVEKSMDKYFTGADSNWGFLLGTGPALFLVTFALVFWIGRGTSALGFLARYEVRGHDAAGPELYRNTLRVYPARIV